MQRAFRRPSTTIDADILRFSMGNGAALLRELGPLVGSGAMDIFDFVHHPLTVEFSRMLEEMPEPDPEQRRRFIHRQLLGIYSMFRWDGCSRPLYITDDNLVDALARTRWPAGVLPGELALPAPVLYLQPQSMLLDMGSFSGFKAHGIIVQHILLPDEERGLSLVAWGGTGCGPHGVKVGFRLDRPFEEKPDYCEIPGIRFAVNFLVAWNETKAIELVERRPPAVKSGRKQAKMARQGRADLPYTVVSLSERARRIVYTGSGQGSGTGTSPRRHLTAMYFNRYWVRAENVGEDDKITAEKPGAHGPLHRVTRLIAPHYRGTGEVLPKTVKVVP